MAEAVLALEGICKTYRQGSEALHILQQLDLSIGQGETVALVGPSGSGKTTLLQIAGLLDAPDAGSIRLQGRDCTALSEQARTRLRGNVIGFVYQFHHLLPELTALENVQMPQWIAGAGRGQAEERARQLLGMVRLEYRLTHRPSELSGGECQRVAIARALANNPALVLADEPTGNLDPETGEAVFTAFREALSASCAGALIATHNMELAKRMDRVVTLQGGKLRDSFPDCKL